MRPLSTSDLNPAILKVEYAVRGELAIKAEEYRKRLALGGEHGLPFDKVISSNIGNPQQKGLVQPPITFIRQVSERGASMRAGVLTGALRRLRRYASGPRLRSWRQMRSRRT